MCKFQEIIINLENIFNLAIENGNLPVALRAKEMIAKHYGFFDKSKTSEHIDAISEENLEHVLTQLAIDAQEMVKLPRQS